MSSAPLSKRANSKNSRWFMALFFGIFLLIGLAVTGSFGWSLVNVFRSSSWPQVPCVVESSEVKTHSGSDGSTYSIKIVYNYTFKNQNYQGNRYSFMFGSSSGLEGKAEIVAQHPPGKATVCYVNPKNPSQAVLNRGFTPEMFIILVPLLFVLVGAGGMFFVLKGAPKKSKRTAGNISGSPTPSPAAPGAPAVLKPKASAFSKMCGMFLFALIWNGVISIFLYQAFKSWQSGHPDWVLTLFMIPFALIGIGTILGIFYFMLAMGNPTAKLALNPPEGTLGENLRLGWGFDGKTGRIKNLRITLEAREEATYRRGTRTYTDRSTFYRQNLADISDSRQIVQGIAETEIPRDLMHTFASENNKIVWTLTIHGSIPCWPDVNEEFEINVLPLRRLL